MATHWKSQSIYKRVRTVLMCEHDTLVSYDTIYRYAGSVGFKCLLCRSRQVLICNVKSNLRTFFDRALEE